MGKLNVQAETMVCGICGSNFVARMQNPFYGGVGGLSRIVVTATKPGSSLLSG